MYLEGSSGQPVDGPRIQPGISKTWR